MPSQILETLTANRLGFYASLLGSRAYTCATCTTPLEVDDLVEPLGGDAVKSLNCGDCAVKNYQSRVSHAETGLQYAKGELRSVTQEVAARKRQKRQEPSLSR